MGRRGVGYAVTFRSLPAALAPAHPILLCSALPVWLCAARRIPTCAGWLSVASNLHRKGGDNRQVAPLPDRWLPSTETKKQTQQQPAAASDMSIWITSVHHQRSVLDTV